MAGNAIIGALRVVIGADSAALETGLKKAASSLDGFAKKAGFAGVAIAGALTAAMLGVGLAIKGAIDEAAKMSRLAESVGVPVEQLTALRVAARLSGVEIETLAKSMGILNKNMAAAAAGGISEIDIKAGKAARAFQSLGIQVRDSSGNIKGGDQILLEIAGKFETFENSASKSAIAMAIFGKAGAAMIPLLNQGKAGLEAMMKEADALGLVIGTKTGKAAIEFNNTLLRMQMIKEGIIVQLTTRLLPEFQRLANIMLEVRSNSSLMTAAADGIVKVVKFIVSETILGVAALTNFSNALGAMATMAKALFKTFVAEPTFDMSAIKAAAAEYSKVMVESEIRSEAARVAAASVWVDARAAFEQYDNVIQTKKPFAPVIAGATAAKNALQSFIDSQKKSTDSTLAEIATFNMAAGAKEQYKIQLQAATVAAAAGIVPNAALQAEINKVALAAGNAKLQLEGLNLVQASLTPWAQYQIALENSNIALLKLGATAEQIMWANRKVAMDFGFSWEQQSASVAGSISNIANTFGEKNKKMAAVAKVFGALQALIAAYAAAAQTLATVPFPGNIAAAASVLAAGIGFAMSIKSLAVPSAAHGGDFMVGGAGGVDNNLVAMNLSRGERVRVDPAGKQSMGEERTIAIQGIEPRHYYRGDVLRDLIENINEAIGDGASLKVALA